MSKAAMTAFGDLVDPAVTRIFHTKILETDEVADLFNTESTDQPEDKVGGVTGFGNFNLKEEGKGITYLQAYQKNKATFTQAVFAGGMRVTKELWKFDKFAAVARLAMKLARSASYTKSYAKVQVVNRAFNSAYTGPDGIELASLIHPLEGGSTEQNELTTTGTAFAPGSLKEAKYTFKKTVNDQGQIAGIEPRILTVPTELEDYADEVINSDRLADVGNNNRNSLKGKFRVVSSPRLSSTTAWSIYDEKDGHGLLEIESQAIELEGPEPDFDTKDLKWSADYMHDVGWFDWVGTFFAEGA